MSPIRSSIRLRQLIAGSCPNECQGMPVAVDAQRAAPGASAPASLVDGPELNALKNLRWRWIGPANQAGRIPVVMDVPGDRSIHNIGAAAGGLLKTTNGGADLR